MATVHESGFSRASSSSLLDRHRHRGAGTLAERLDEATGVLALDAIDVDISGALIVGATPTLVAWGSASTIASASVCASGATLMKPPRRSGQTT